MRWGDLLAGLDGPGGLGELGRFELTGDPDVEVDTITHDSRRVDPGACFACIPGARTDGHDHAPEAVARGAVALLVERPLPLAVSQARVPSVRAALGPLAATLHGHPSATMRVLGVTGTNGKTTTTYLLEAIGRAAGERVGVIGTVGARIAGETVATAHTTPEASDLQGLLARHARRRRRHRGDGGVVARARAASRRRRAVRRGVLHQPQSRASRLPRHDGCVLRGQGAPVRTASPRAAAVNLDDPRGVELAARVRTTDLDLWTFAVDDESADVTAETPSFAPDGTASTFVDRRAGERVALRLPLVGPFNLANALAAAATARAAGFPLATVADGLAQPLVVPGRFERVDAGQPFTVLVDYAHTPDALGRVLAAARPLAGAGGRVVCVFGCGGDRDPAKRPLMGAAVAAAADVAVLTSDNPRSEDPQAIADAVLPGLTAGSASVTVELDRRVAIVAALAAAAPGDVVVIAGKGHETGQTARGRTRPFDDRVVAREELGALGWS